MEDLVLCRRCGGLAEEQDMCPVPGPPFEVCVWCVEDRPGVDVNDEDCHGQPKDFGEAA